MRQAISAWIATTGRKPSSSAQKPNDETKRKSRIISRAAVRVIRLVIVPPVCWTGRKMHDKL